MSAKTIEKPDSFRRKIADELSSIRAKNLSRIRRTTEFADGARAKISGREIISFASNDYLGLASHPRICRAFADAALQFGAGGCASHLLGGHHRLHDELESTFAEFVGAPQSLFFSAGYMAAIGTIPSLVGHGDSVFADRLNHACLNDAALLSRAKFLRYPHCDLSALSRLLADSNAKKKLVVTDSVFSMDGDIADLPALFNLCEKFDAHLFIDDAHGFGVLGKTGRGSLSHFGLKFHPRIIYMATLGKAAGVGGAVIAASNDIIELLINRARAYICTTASPPAIAAALLESLSQIESGDSARRKLNSNIKQFRQGMKKMKWDFLDSRTPIQPLILADSAAALSLSDSLWRKGLWAPAIRPPTATPRLRIALSAAHDSADIAALISALNEKKGDML